MQFHNYLFRQCTGAWKTAWDTFFPLGNAIREYVNLTNMRKAVPYWWTMKKTTSFFSGFVRCAPPCQDWSNPYSLIKPDSWKVWRHCAASFDLQREFDIICTTFDNALEINKRRTVLFDYIWPWTLISCMQFWLQICMSEVLSKKGKILPRDTRELVLSGSLKRYSRGKWVYVWEIKIICYETLSERWTVSEERSPRHQSFAHSLFIAAVLAHPTFICLL